MKYSTLINKLNDPISFPGEELIQSLFEKQEKKTPNNIALVHDKREITYEKLNIRSNQVAHYLRKKGLNRNTIVGLYMEKSIDSIICILAILKAGGTYLPIDKIYPGERVEFILNDSNCSFLITDDKCDLKHNCKHHIVYNQEKFESEESYNLSYINSPNDVAYIIYTSGTTGKPKGVLIEHQNVIRLFFNDKCLFDFKNTDVWTLFHSLCFDFSVWEMYGALLFGGKLVIVTRNIARDTNAFINLLIENKITVLNQTPSSFYNLINLSNAYDESSFDLRYIIFGGEKLELHRLKKWMTKFTGPRLINMFGITETTVHVTYKEITGNDIESGGSNIGYPIPTLDAFVFYDKNKLAGIDEIGELYVGGLGLGRGYLNIPELTHDKFINHNEFGRLYKSGDLVKIISKDEMEYIGRNDDQIKIRGFRIEKGEIAEKILENRIVSDVYIDLEDNMDNKILNAYIIPNREILPAFHSIITQLTQVKLDKLFLQELPNGMSVFCINNYETNFMYNEIFQNRCYLKHGVTLERNAVVFDIGANIGLFSIFIQNIYRDSTIYSFEPIPPIYEVLKRNVEFFSLNAKIFKEGLSDINRDEKFTYYPFASVLSGKFANSDEEFKTVYSHMSSYDKDKVAKEYLDDLINYRLSSEEYSVKLYSLSTIINRERIDKIDLLKIDVEKSELDVLKGINDDHWKIIKQLIIEVHDIDGILNEIIKLLTDKGFDYTIDQDSDTSVSNLYNIYARSFKFFDTKDPQDSKVFTDIETREEFVSSKKWVSETLKESLARTLPDYMIPQNFFFIDNAPLTPNGKLDMESLRNSKAQKDVRRENVNLNTTQKQLKRIWSKTLNIPDYDISIYDNFFELGGNSLNATLLLSEIQNQFKIKLKVADIFENETIEDVSTILEKYIN